MLKKPGRPREPITMEQIRTVLEAHSKYHLGTCLLECVLEVEIHKILKECGSARREPKKAKRRKWMIAYLDNSSRLVVAYGLFASATTENAIAVMEEGIKRYGLPEAVLLHKNE